MKYIKYLRWFFFERGNTAVQIRAEAVKRVVGRKLTDMMARIVVGRSKSVAREKG